MNIEDIQNKAKALGITIGKKGKLELIREIQQKEGFSPCFGLGMFVCSNIECLWHSDCCGMAVPFRVEE